MNYWAWGGKYIGNRHGDYLYSSKGKPLGFFDSDEVYDFNGKYLCEVKNKNRLVVKSHTLHSLCGARMQPSNICGSSYADYAGYAMYAGYEDFKVTT